MAKIKSIAKNGNGKGSKTYYCYLVYCNQDPIVYAVYSNVKRAMRHARLLINYRKPQGFYHCINDSMSKITLPFDEFEKTVFSCCIKSDEKDYDKCYVKVVRRKLQ